VPSIAIKNLSFAHEGAQPLFKGVSLNLDTSWKLGLVGRNGRGKTTLLRLLEGTLPFQGTISRPFELTYFPFKVEDPSRTARELSAILRPHDHQDYRLEREASLLGLPMEALDRPFGSLSGGEATKALLAILFITDDVFPLMDEPTQNLDMDGQRSIGDYLATKKGFLMVTHDRRLADRCLDHVLSINRAGLELVKGNFKSFWEDRQRRNAEEEARVEKLSKETARLEEASKRSTAWAYKCEKEKYGHGPVDRGFIGHKAAQMQKRAKATEARRARALEEKSSIPRNTERPSRLSMRPLRYHGRILAHGSHLTVGYGDTPVLRDFSFTLREGGVLAASGPNGSGKSLFMRLLMGKAKILSGEFGMPGNITVSHVPQNPDLGALSLREVARGMHVEASALMTVLRHLGLERDSFEVPFSSLSLGQRKKVLLAASLCQEAHLYLWDEPLAHVDIISRAEMEDLIARFKPTMVVVEHDEAFLARVATDVLEF
jgi:lincosamide and streptogramin A transport system ATP-binding/permease protein